MPSELVANMNPQQREGIQAVDGPVLLLAGAGSGKTRVITHRIAYLIQERGVPADSILAVTFTNKAAKEMAERVDKILGHTSLAKPMLATFHSFCVRVLRRDIEALRVNGVGLTRTFAIYDETDQQAVVKTALKRLGIDDKQLKPRVALGRISWAKNHMIDPQEYFLASTNPMEEKIAHIFEIYRKELFKANALDFDDLLLETVRLLKSSSEVRERYNRRYKYLLIDEYQDTNRPQYELMKLLAGTSTTSAWSAMRTSPSTAGAARTSRTSWSSRRTSPTRRRSAWSRTTARRRSFSKARRAVVAQQHAAQGQEPVDHARGRLADRLLRGSRRRERGALHRRPHPADISARPDEQRRPAALRRALPHQLAVAAGGRGAAPLSDPVPHGRRLQLL